LLLIVSGWVHRRQLIVIEFRQAENRLLKDLATASAYPEKQGCAFTERFTPQGLCFPSQQRPLSLGKSMLLPDSHRRLVGQKWDFSKRWAPGRPGIMREMSQLIVRMAQENPGWGYTRIQGALANLSHKVGRGTVCNVLKRNGIEPAPERSKRTTWSTFLKAHWKVLAASDFFTVEVWTSRGLLTHYVLFVISVAERVVHIAGITTRPGEAWMLQVGRNLSDEESGALASKRYLIIDRDAKYTPQFRRLVEEGGTEVIRLPPMSPNLNAYAERFVRSIKDECLNRMIFIGQASLRRAISEFMAHYHEERNHQGLENRLIRPTSRRAANTALIQRHVRLGGMFNYYYRTAV